MKNAVLADNTLRDLAMAVARNNVGAMRPLQEVAASEGITLQEYSEIAKNPMFLRYVDIYSTELQENGFSFSAKSRILAEDLLPVAYHMARDVDVPAAVRMKAIENLVEWGDLKPKAAASTQAGAGFSITINIPDPNTGKTTSLTLEHAADSSLLLTPEPRAAITLGDEDDEVYEGDDVYEAYEYQE
jgi:hypothetical protein